jgi:hypothetical protein
VAKKHRRNNKKRLEEKFVADEEKNKIRTDLEFLQSMKHDRSACYTSLDKKMLLENTESLRLQS